MKLTIDDKNKTIEIDDDSNIVELISKLKKILSENELKEYKFKKNKDTKVEYYPIYQHWPIPCIQTPYIHPYIQQQPYVWPSPFIVSL